MYFLRITTVILAAVRTRYWFWDSSERWFCKAERLVEQERFEEALVCFEEAFQTDPQYAHLRAYQALALAELARFDEALIACDTAEQIDPSNTFFLSCRARILLDSEEPGTVIRIVERSSHVGDIYDYYLLAKWDLGDNTALDTLAQRIQGMSPNIASRVAVRVEERIQPIAEESTSSDETRLSRPLLPRWLRTRLDQRRQRRFKRQLAKVDRMLEVSRCEAALRYLEWMKHSTLTVVTDPISWDRQYRRAIEALCTQLRSDIRRFESTSQKKTHALGENENANSTQQQRDYFRRLADCQAKIGNSDRTYEALERWMNNYRAAGSPAAERTNAAHVMIEMADIDIDRRQFDRAARYCREARVLGMTNHNLRINLIEARAALARGDRLASRRHFARHLSRDPAYLARRIARCRV